MAIGTLAMSEPSLCKLISVFPHDKTAYSYGGLETSIEWKKAKEKKQRFLYITGKRDGFYVLNNENERTGDYFNVSDFEPYIDKELMVEQLRKDIDNIKEALSQLLLIDFVAKNKDSFEKLVEESKEEKLEKEIREAFAEYTNKECSYSLQTCFRAGFLAGRESK